MVSSEDLFWVIDGFCQVFEPYWHRQLLQMELQHRRQPRHLCLSQILAILIAFHQSSYRNFKAYYQEKIRVDWQNAFPGLVSCMVGSVE